MSTEKNLCGTCANFNKCGARNVSPKMTVLKCSGYTPMVPNQRYAEKVLHRVCEVVP